MLCLHCCTRLFSSCGERGYSVVVVLGSLTAVASLVVEHGAYVHKLQKLQPVGLISSRHVESSWTRD